MSLRGFATLNFWADDPAAAAAWYTEFLGAEPYFVTASVVDPFGNVLGVMYNPHYAEVLASRAA